MKPLLLLITLIIVAPPTSIAAPHFGGVQRDVYGFKSSGLGNIYHPSQRSLREVKSSNNRKLYGRSVGRGKLHLPSRFDRNFYGPDYLHFKGNVFSNRSSFRGVPSSWSPKIEKIDKGSRAARTSFSAHDGWSLDTDGSPADRGFEKF